MTNGIPNIAAQMRATCSLGDSCHCAKDVDAMQAGDSAFEALSSGALLVSVRGNTATIHGAPMGPPEELLTMSIVSAMFNVDEVILATTDDEAAATADVDHTQADEPGSAVMQMLKGLMSSVPGFAAGRREHAPADQSGDLQTA